MSNRKDQIVSDIENQRKLRNVERLSSQFKIKPYPLSDHSLGVAYMFIRIAKCEGIPISVDAVERVMMHDVLEIKTGDLLYPAKNLDDQTSSCWDIIEQKVAEANGMLHYTDNQLELSLNPAQLKLFKVCDLLELYLYCYEEHQIGNSTSGIKEVLDACFNTIKGSFETVDKILLKNQIE